MFSTFSNSRKNTPQKRDGKGIDMVALFFGVWFWLAIETQLATRPLGTDFQ